MARRESKFGNWWYKQTKKSVFINWVDDNVVWYLYDKPRDRYETVRHWLYCNWNREHWELVKQAFCSYGWDGLFIYELEEKQIDKQLKWFSNHQILADEQYNEIMRSLKWAKYLIHTINDESALYHFTGEPKRVELPTGGYRYESGIFTCHYDGPYINKRNAKRFLTNGQLESEYFMGGNCDHEIYLIKCKHLYHKVREKYTNYWWD